MRNGEAAVIDRAGLGRLVEALIDDGYRVVGPAVGGEAIVLEELDSAECLPDGWGVETGPGRYRLRRRADSAVFGHSSGPQSWKRFLHPPRRRLWSSGADGVFEPAEEEAGDTPRYAFLGVRGCDLASIGILGTVLGGGAHPDGSFSRRRGSALVIAVNCTEPGEVCFCASMGTGPGVDAAGPGYDLALTERIDADGHRFLVNVGSAEGARVISLVAHRAADSAEIASARDDVEAAAGAMGRQMPSGDLRELMRESRESTHWDDVSSRCLTCANCTLVCPTCFCTTTEDVTDLTGDNVERWQHWASCFELDFTYMHGGSTRASGASRYRQWLSHKLGTWHDQFGGSGCVGCGRCIAWCPDYIDTLDTSTPISAHVPVDFELRGCPIDRGQLLETLTALLAGREPAIPNSSVCTECKRRGLTCVMVAEGTPCLGPVTQAGCGALCPAYHRGCFGCFGPMDTPNAAALIPQLRAWGLPDEAIDRMFTTFNAASPAFAKEARNQGEPPQ